MLLSLFEDFVKLAMQISLGTLSSSILVLFLSWKKIPLSLKYLTFFLIWNFLTEVTAFLLLENDIGNLPLLHIYTLGEFLLFSLFYREINLKATFLTKNIFILVSSLLIILNTVFLQDIAGFNSNAKTFVQVTIIINAILFFYQNSSELKAPNSSIKLINSAILIYYSGSLFIFMFSNYFLSRGIKIHRAFWDFNTLLNFLFQVLIFIAIWRFTHKEAISPTPLNKQL